MKHKIRRRMFYEKKGVVMFLSLAPMEGGTMAIWSTHYFLGDFKNPPSLEQMAKRYQGVHDRQIDQIIKEENERELRENPEYHIQTIEDQTTQTLNP